MNRWKHIYFFDKNGKYYNFDYSETTDMWSGNIYLPEVSTGLFEVGQIFILQEFIQQSTSTKKFGYPHSFEAPPTGVTGVTGNTGSTGGSTGTCDWIIDWETSDPEDIFLFQFNTEFSTATQSSLEVEVPGPPLIKYDQISIPLDYDLTQTVDTNGYVVTNDIRSEAIQINFTINSNEENTFKRTLIIRDECTGSIVGKFTVYAETIGEDERLKVMTENLGYTISMDDSLIFRDTNVYEQFPNFIEVNRKRKELMMEGHNIYPYIGSYKGLINAIKFFGYNNLQVKEFWKNINKSSPRYGKYIQSNPINIFDPQVNYNDMSISLPNKNFRKTNMFSLIYKINKVKEGKYDFLDLPITEEVFDYSIEEILIKLFGLKRKLEKEFLPLNAHIKDIIGEADFFGLASVTNTISRNDKRNINAGISADFKVSPDDCTYLEDLRTFSGFCLAQGGIVGQAVVGLCNAYINPFTISSGGGTVNQNLLLGPYSQGDVLPAPPFGPDINSVLGIPSGGQNVTINEISDVFMAYFSGYAPNLNQVGTPPAGLSSLYLPDKPNIPIGALVVLENDSFNSLTWNDIGMTYDQVSNANKFHTFDLDPQGAYEGDIFIINDPITNTGATYVVQPGDDDTDVRDAIYNQLIILKNNFITPWLHWDTSTITLPVTGSAIRLFGSDTQRIELKVIRSPLSGAIFNKIDNPGETLYTWGSIQRGNFSEIEWTVYKESTEVSPEYFFTFRGPINQYDSLPLVLPYVGTYSVEMRLYDLFNNISSIVKTDAICIDAKEVEYSGWYHGRKETYTWSAEGKWKWNDHGSSWNLPIEPSVTWDEETPSLYESLDRVNAILNNFGLGASPNFTLLNYQNNGKVSFSGPYFWNNLKGGNWNDSYHLWWDLTAVSGDTPAFFQFKEIVQNTYLRIIDVKGNIGSFYFGPTITTLAQAASALNLSNDPVINKYIYNVVYDASNNQKFIQAVSRYFGVYGDWADVDIVDVNDNRICASEYNNGSIISLTGDGSDFFKKEVTVNGVRIVVAGDVGGQTAVPDAFTEKVARMFELFTDPSGSGINETFQRNLIKTLSGDSGTYHAGLPTIQRVARGAGSDYTPNFLDDAGILYWNLTNLFDTHVQNDMVWYLNSTGDISGSGDIDAQEVIEHIFHTLHMHGLPADDIKLYSYLASDWQTGDLYLAMEEAYDAGLWDSSGYGGNSWKTDSDAFEVAAKEYLYLLNFAMFEYTDLWENGSLSPEWDDSMRTQAGILANNPLGYAFHNTYISPTISKPSLATIRSIFQDGDLGDPTVAGESGYVVTPTGTGCESLIYRKGLHTASNPSWSTARFINNGVTLPKLTWIMFVYDKCKINGKDKPKWIIKNTTDLNMPDIYFESKYLTYLFQKPGRYEIGLELTDSNGNKYKKERNILIIK